MGKLNSITNRPVLSKPALVVLVLVLTGLAYASASSAINTGSWLEYATTLILVSLVVHFLKQLFYRFKYVKK